LVSSLHFSVERKATFVPVRIDVTIRINLKFDLGHRPRRRTCDYIAVLGVKDRPVTGAEEIILPILPTLDRFLIEMNLTAKVSADRVVGYEIARC